MKLSTRIVPAPMDALKKWLAASLGIVVFHFLKLCPGKYSVKIDSTAASPVETSEIMLF